jgi:N-methylhydantoinase B/oxoprolinase/acetone carboxylase alpha subunit
MTNTQNTPIEALERAFPLRVLRYRLRRGSGGAGRFAGGEGIERDLEVLEECTVSLITERRVSPPWGLQGGGPGAVGESWVLPGGFERLAKRLPRQVHAPAQVRRRVADAHPRRRRLGTATRSRVRAGW